MPPIEIPLAFRNPLAASTIVPPPVQVYDSAPYAPGRYRAPQPVLAGRRIPQPRLDLGDYRARAEIVWVSLRLDTPGQHQAINMQRAVTRLIDARGGAYSVFVTDPKGEKRYQGDRFIRRFQDPDPDRFRGLLDAILWTYGDGTEARDDLAIAAIEVSAGVYVRRSRTLGAREATWRRWLLVDLMRRHLRPDPVLTEAPLCCPRWYGASCGKSGATFALDDRRGRATPHTPHLRRLGVDDRFQSALGLGAHHQPPGRCDLLDRGTRCPRHAALDGQDHRPARSGDRQR